ncbi:DgyrCDS9798 [Dimorphilus gyrociliatus]|uniref:DgyrCDS9798 n=1 Tax=Dimorphilus gyrociliatus TaxID=2664684 RepID=A0A7I8W0S1_9ANNE|nr:DgyrCDS9798 [Dimorphilus gyrociliatus]
MDMNIFELIRGRKHNLAESRTKRLVFQLLKAVDYMHRNGIFHRDVKPENVLIKDDVLKLADFGSCRSIHSRAPYTEYISTRWYRAPECLLTDGYYSFKMDIWSVGCVLFEVMCLYPLFPGSNEVDQISKIHDIIGTPDPSILDKLKNKTRGINFNFPPKKGSGIEKLMPHAPRDCIDLIYKMCTYDPDERLTARQALKHSYFKELREQERRAKAERRMEEEHANSVKLLETKVISNNASTTPRPTSATRRNNNFFRSEGVKRKKDKHKRRMVLSSNNGMANELPKMNVMHSTYKPTFHLSSYTTAGSYPKIKAKEISSTDPLPRINTLFKQKKVKQSNQTSKNIINGHYQLPSIER